MTTEEAIRILTVHNKWRRGEPPYDDMPGYHAEYHAKQVGLAIDKAIEVMTTTLNKAQANGK